MTSETKIRIEPIADANALWDAIDADGNPVAIVDYSESKSRFIVCPYDAPSFEAEDLESAAAKLSENLEREAAAMAKVESLPAAGLVDFCDAATLEVIREAINAMGFQAFEYDAGGAKYVAVSAENGDNAADYYGEFRGGYPWICDKLEKLAKRCGAYWEWINPGAIMLNL